jgi:hypothetical protein
MKKIRYNLAGTRKIDRRAFALTLAVLGLAVVFFNAVTFFSLARQQKLGRAEKSEIRFAAAKLENLRQEMLQRQIGIDVLKKTWEQKLAYANFMIGRKSFSFIARLNFIEKICSAGMSIRQLDLTNDASGRVEMTVSALAQNELLGLYKKLLPHELIIDNENQMTESYQAKLSFRMADEKK